MKILIDHFVIDQALEALDGLSEPYDVLKAITALRQAKEQAQDTPPVGYLHADGKFTLCEEMPTGEWWPLPLYTHRPPRQPHPDEFICPICYDQPRQPLTDDEIRRLWWARPELPDGEDNSMGEIKAFARAIEAAHGIKGEA